MNKSLSKGKYWVHIGWNWKRVALGFSIDKWGANIDLGPFWLGIEW